MNSSFTEKILHDLTKIGIFAGRIMSFDDGSSQSTYKIETGKQSLVLKLFDHSRYNALQNEITLLHKLATYYDSILLPIHKNPVMIVGMPAYIYKFFDGKRFSEVLIKEKYFQFGKIVAKINIALKELHTDLSIISNRDLFYLPSKIRSNTPANKLIGDAAKLFNKKILTIDSSQIRKQYIHKDLHFYNVIYNIVNGKYLIIDTGGISVQFLPREIAVSVGNALLDSRNHFSKDNIKKLMKGYNTLIRFNKTEKRTIPLFIIQKKLGELDYLHKQLQSPNLGIRKTNIIKKTISESEKTLKYVIDNYDSLVHFFSEIN